MTALKRRDILLACAAASALPRTALAHHGWSSFDDTKPLYLQGKANSVKWQNPHVEVMLQLPAAMQLPADLGQRNIPAQYAPVDVRSILAKTQLPARKDKTWDIELAPLSRMEAWKVAEIKPGSPFAVVGYSFKDEKGDAILRAEFIWVDGKTYALRSSPA